MNPLHEPHESPRSSGTSTPCTRPSEPRALGSLRSESFVLTFGQLRGGSISQSPTP